MALVHVSTGCPCLVACRLRFRVGSETWPARTKPADTTPAGGTRQMHLKDFDSSASLVRDLDRGQATRPIAPRDPRRRRAAAAVPAIGGLHRRRVCVAAWTTSTALLMLFHPSPPSEATPVASYVAGKARCVPRTRGASRAVSSSCCVGHFGGLLPSHDEPDGSGGGCTVHRAAAFHRAS